MTTFDLILEAIDNHDLESARAQFNARVEEEYNLGYDNGYRDGYDTGYDAGYDQGLDDAY